GRPSRLAHARRLAERGRSPSGRRPAERERGAGGQRGHPGLALAALPERVRGARGGPPRRTAVLPHARAALTVNRALAGRTGVAVAEVVAAELHGVGLEAGREEPGAQAGLVERDRVVLDGEGGVEDRQVGLLSAREGLAPPLEEGEDGRGHAGGACDPQHEGAPRDRAGRKAGAQDSVSIQSWVTV